MKWLRKSFFIIPIMIVTIACGVSSPAPVGVVTTASGFAPVIPSSTLSPNSTASQTTTLTWTPLPTLSIDQARKTVGNLILNNGNCKIPCWWGIVPSKTTWFEALHFLATFSEIKQGGSGSYYENGKMHYTTNYGIYYKISGKTESGHLNIGVQDDIVIDVTVDPLGNERNYQFHQILTLFGKPNQIYVSAQPDTQTKELLPAIVILDYSNVGVIASYEFPLYKAGKNLRICPEPVGARFELQDPNIKYPHVLSIDEYVGMITGFNPKKLGDVSNLNIQSFYETFQNPSPAQCLETPVDLWP